MKRQSKTLITLALLTSTLTAGCGGFEKDKKKSSKPKKPNDIVTPSQECDEDRKMICREESDGVYARYITRRTGEACEFEVFNDEVEMKHCEAGVEPVDQIDPVDPDPVDSVEEDQWLSCNEFYVTPRIGKEADLFDSIDLENKIGTVKKNAYFKKSSSKYSVELEDVNGNKLKGFFNPDDVTDTCPSGVEISYMTGKDTYLYSSIPVGADLPEGSCSVKKGTVFSPKIFEPQLNDQLFYAKVGLEEPFPGCNSTEGLMSIISSVPGYYFYGKPTEAMNKLAAIKATVSDDGSI